MKIQQKLLPYNQALESRSLKDIGLVVIHCTELPDIETARTYGEKIHYDSGTGNSGHFYIDRDGSIQQWVDLKRVAHHVINQNKRSIGIELINQGRYPHWYQSNNQKPTEPYTKAQIAALIGLINFLGCQLQNLIHIAGHEDLDLATIAAEDNPDIMIKRKIDPGPLFPWEQVMQNIKLINIGSHAKNYE